MDISRHFLKCAAHQVKFAARLQLQKQQQQQSRQQQPKAAPYHASHVQKYHNMVYTQGTG